MDYIIETSGYKMTPWEKAPQAEQGTAILLYRASDGPQNGLVIEYGKRILSSVVRKGKYDTYVLVDIKTKTIKFKEKLQTQEEYCDFLIDIEVNYSVADIRDIVFNSRRYPIEEMKKWLYHNTQMENKKFGLHNAMELQNRLMEIYEMIKFSFSYLNIEISALVTLDETGTRILESEKKKGAESVIADNEQQYAMKKIKTEEELKRFQNQEELITKEEKTEREQALSDKRISHAVGQYEKYGVNAMLLEAYGNGKISETELHEILREQQKADRAEQMEQYWRSVDANTVNDEQMDKFSDKFIFSSVSQGVLQGDERKVIEQKREIEEIIIDDTDEY